MITTDSLALNVRHVGLRTSLCRCSLQLKPSFRSSPSGSRRASLKHACSLRCVGDEIDQNADAAPLCGVGEFERRRGYYNIQRTPERRETLRYISQAL